MSAPIYAELSSVLAKKSVSMHYRRTEVRLLTITKDKLEFVSDQLFSDEMPCRLVVFFVEEDARNGLTPKFNGNSAKPQRHVISRF